MYILGNNQLTTKDKIMSSLKITSQHSSGKTNPLRSSNSIDNALRLLLSSRNDVTQNGVEAVGQAYDELLQHQRAVMNAMRNALGDYLSYFEPQALERLFAEQKKRTGSTNDAFRELYAEAFEGLAQPNQHKLPQAFDDEFARAYELETTD